MTAAVASPEVESPAPPQEPISLDQALAELEPPEDDPVEDEDQPEGEGESPDEPVAAAKPDDKEDFSDDRPWTPERIKSAAAKAKELQRAAADRWVKVEKREGKFDKKLTEYKKDRDMVFAVRDQIAADLRIIKNGTPAERMAALGRLAQQDGHKFYEDLSLGLAGRKADPQAAELAEVKARLEAFEQKEKQREQEAQQGADVFAARQRVVAGVRDAQRFPLLAKAAEQWGFAETCGVIEKSALSKYGSFGQRVDIDGLLVQAEYHLRNDPDLVGPGADSKQPPAGSGPEAGREPSAADAAKPELARRTPGKSVPSSLASRPSSRNRPIEEGESDDELANDPDFLRQLGVPV